jgi:acetyltransferase-like isoleucine patch superfamily enzyme
MLWVYLAFRFPYYFLKRVCICEPLLKAYCTRYGKGLHTDVFVHWVQGKGELILGDHVEFDGKCSITFAVRFAEHPTLTVGDRTGISHNCAFHIGKQIVIGHDCRIASDVLMFDSSGHPTNPIARQDGSPPSADDVKPITIGNNVWIGRRAVIFPGVTIGDGSIISTCTVVTTDVAPYTIVAGNPARRIGSASVPREPIKSTT